MWTDRSYIMKTISQNKSVKLNDQAGRRNKLLQSFCLFQKDVLQTFVVVMEVLLTRIVDVSVQMDHRTVRKDNLQPELMLNRTVLNWNEQIDKQIQ